MTLNILQGVKQAISTLDPQEIRNQVERPFCVGLHAESEASFRQMDRFFIPENISDEKRFQLHRILRRAADSERCDIDIYSHGLTAPRDGFYFSPQNPEHTV